MLFSAISLVLAFLLMLSNYLLFIGWVYTIFNSCTCISMSCHTAIIITLQRLLCYLLHAFCFSPLISPDFARRGCPELNTKVQVQQQKTWKKAEGLYRPILHWSFKKTRIYPFAALKCILQLTIICMPSEACLQPFALVSW